MTYVVPTSRIWLGVYAYSDDGGKTVQHLTLSERAELEAGFVMEGEE